jgi:DNA-directed RNA polymerase specialized sigma24 family protein
MEGPPGDETLLVAVAERDIGALRTLYERHAGWLALRLARRCNDRDLMTDAVQAVVLDGLSAREAAQLLHVPVSSVKTRLYRAKVHLRAVLAEGSS